MTESASIRLIPIDQRESWAHEHAAGGLPGQSWDYAWGLTTDIVQPQLAVVQADGARMLVPFFERTFEGVTDVATLLGLSGASLSAPAPGLLAAWRRFARERGWVSGYLHFSSTPELILQDRLQGEPINSTECFILDLAPPDLMPTLTFNIRQKVRWAEREGVAAAEQAEELAGLMPPLYAQAAARLHVSRPYQFTQQTLSRWALSPDTLVLGARVGGRIVAVSLFIQAGTHAEYLVNAAGDEGRPYTAWLIVQAAARLRARGVRTFNIAGGMHPGDGLYHFKRRFRGRPVTMHSIGQIYDRATFDRLCSGLAAAERDSGWFPPYRTRLDT